MVFTGDFVCGGDVGRPDLLEEAAGIANTKELGAKQMYESLEKFAKLPDYVQVWSGHGAGSTCGKGLCSVPSLKDGYEKIRNCASQYEGDEQGIIDYGLSEQQERQRYCATKKN